MKLTKLNEAYTLIDSNDKWMTSGNVTRELNGSMNINFNSTLKTGDGSETYWGSLAYHKSESGNISANYNFDNAYKGDFVDYCEEIVNQVIEELS